MIPAGADQVRNIRSAMENNQKLIKRIILFRFHDHFDICAAVLNSPEYNTTLADLQKYFLYFGIAARASI